MPFLDISEAHGAPPEHKLTDEQFTTLEESLAKKLCTNARSELQDIVDRYLARADFQYTIKSKPIVQFYDRLEKQFMNLQALLDEGPRSNHPDAGTASKIIYARSRGMLGQPDLDELFSIAVHGAQDCQDAKAKLQEEDCQDSKVISYILKGKKQKGRETDPEYDEFVRKLVNWAEKRGIPANADNDVIVDKRRETFVAFVESLTALLGDKIPQPTAKTESTIRRLTEGRRARAGKKSQN